MAIKIYEKFAPRANPADGDYPYGSIKNESVPGAKDGTPLDAALGNDMVGFTDALLAEAGITPSGNPDTVVSSQRLDALKSIAGSIAHTGAGRNVAGAHDEIYRRAATVAQVENGDFGVGARLSLTDRADAPFNIEPVGDYIVNGFDIIDAGVGRVAVLIAQISLNWGAFGVKTDGSDTSENLDRAISFAIENDIELVCTGGQTIKSTAAVFDCTNKSVSLRFINSGIKLKDGTAWATGQPMTFNDAKTFKCDGLEFDGNRNNVTGNLAGLATVRRALNIAISNTRINDLRRFGWNIVDDAIRPNTNVNITNTYCDNIGVQSGGLSVALGEAIKCERIDNLTIDGFYVKNSSGTGDGQVQKAFHCNNVALKNVFIENASPSFVYPSISNVRNNSISHTNVKIIGDSQVAIEDNANINSDYVNIITSGRKAAIFGTDGAGSGDRSSENLNISNWIDVSSEVIAFNVIGVVGFNVERLQTNKQINISQDGAARRSSKVNLSNVSCDTLNTLGVLSHLSLRNVIVAGQWSNTSPLTASAHDVVFGSYSDSSLSGVVIVRTSARSNTINIAGAIGAGGSLVFNAPKEISNAPFAGVIQAVNKLSASPATQWSQITYHFYNEGTDTVLKTVIQSGSIPRSMISAATNRTDRTITFINTDSVATSFVANVNFIDSTLNSEL